MGGDITGTAMDISGLDNIGVQLVFTGTPTGTFTIQGSNDNTTWANITTSPTTISASGSASDHLISLSGLPFHYLRVKYTRASSTGTLNAYVTGKAV